jgi:hypothetical protein
MRVEKGVMVALGYGKYFRSDSIVGFEPIEEDEGRGPESARASTFRDRSSRLPLRAPRAPFCVTWCRCRMR